MANSTVETEETPVILVLGSLEHRYAIYVENARSLGWIVKTFDEWLAS